MSSETTKMCFVPLQMRADLALSHFQKVADNTRMGKVSCKRENCSSLFLFHPNRSNFFSLLLN